MALTTGLYQESIAEESIKIACVGNSITEGVGLSNRSEEAYPAVLQEILGKGYEVRNFGKGGACILREGSRSYWDTDEFKGVFSFEPDIVTILLGTVDSKTDNWYHKDDFERDLGDLIDTFSGIESHPSLYLCIPIPAIKTFNTMNDPTIKNEIIPRIERVAGEKNIPIIDTRTPFENQDEYYQSDGIHPTKEGAVLLAETIAKAIVKTGLDTEKVRISNHTVDKKNSACLCFRVIRRSNGKKKKEVSGERLMSLLGQKLVRITVRNRLIIVADQ
jgi:lysophospholipase L1-like esterase